MADANSRTLIVGLGATGSSVARYLGARGESMLAVDSRPEPPGIEAFRSAWPHVPVSLGNLGVEALEGATRVILSPGLSPDIELVVAARARGIPVVGDIELFAQAAQAPIVAVTGSNGKSTVATLTDEILKSQGVKSLSGGNLGPPALDLLAEGTPDVYVIEVSSFQMETTSSLRPVVAAVLNLSADHLDRHRSLERYAELKNRLLEAAATGVYNFDDPLVRAMGAKHSNGVAFSVREPLTDGYCVIDHRDERWLMRNREPLIRSAELALTGALGEANSLAALALAESMHGPIEPALEVLRNFAGLPHRCRRLRDVGGVAYFDDSKATNVAAAAAAVNSVDGPVVLIAGGLAKGADFATLRAETLGKLRAAVLIGQAADALEAALAGACLTRRASSMREAVEAAAELAVPGDVVLLAPACASQDMFTDYRDRGEQFALAVAGLDR